MRTTPRGLARALAIAAAATLALVPATMATAQDSPAYPLIDEDATVTLNVYKHVGPVAGLPNNGTEQPEIENPVFPGINFDLYRVQIWTTNDEGELDWEDVDLTTNVGWEQANAVRGATVASPGNNFVFQAGGETFRLSHVGTEATDSDGLADFTISVGLYYVVENLATSGSVVNGVRVITDPAGNVVPVANIVGAQPFFVTLPMTDPGPRESWMYDVYVYPKNTITEKPHKSVNDADTSDPEVDEDGVAIGDVLTYTVSGVVPNYGDVVGAPRDPDAEGPDGLLTGPDGTIDGWDLGEFSVWDSFDPALGNIVVTRVAAVSPVEPGGTHDGISDQDTVLQEVEDYVVLPADRGGRTVVEVVFTTAGLHKVAQHHSGQDGIEPFTISVTYTAEVVSLPEDGEIKNQAITIPGPVPGEGGTPPTPPTEDEPPTEEPPGDPTNEVITKYGYIEIFKTGETGADPVALEGAIFEVYRATATQVFEEDGDPELDEDGNLVWDYTCIPATFGDPLDTFETDATGYGVSTRMLGISNWYNDGLYMPDPETDVPPNGTNDGYYSGLEYSQRFGERQYCLVETKAPDGYQLLAEPELFRLTQVGAAKQIDLTDMREIVNQQDNFGNNLPLTGGEGAAAV
ncbi:MAG: SpaH/EbpB family LPXTG-anchored major pilin, partial [bacterium]|nr:SpaH/EbpB family LPXTG-anchored major pilin [bacterium]